MSATTPLTESAGRSAGVRRFPLLIVLWVVAVISLDLAALEWAHWFVAGDFAAQWQPTAALVTMVALPLAHGQLGLLAAWLSLGTAPLASRMMVAAAGCATWWGLLTHFDGQSLIAELAFHFAAALTTTLGLSLLGYRWRELHREREMRTRQNVQFSLSRLLALTAACALAFYSLGAARFDDVLFAQRGSLASLGPAGALATLGFCLVVQQRQRAIVHRVATPLAAVLASTVVPALFASQPGLWLTLNYLLLPQTLLIVSALEVSRHDDWGIRRSGP